MRILKKKKLVKEEKQTPFMSDEDFNEGKLGEVDSLVRKIEILNYRRDINFHIP